MLLSETVRQVIQIVVKEAETSATEPPVTNFLLDLDDTVFFMYICHN